MENKYSVKVEGRFKGNMQRQIKEGQMISEYKGNILLSPEKSKSITRLKYSGFIINTSTEETRFKTDDAKIAKIS